MELGINHPTTIQQSVITSVDNERVEKVLYHEKRGTPNDTVMVWQEYASVEELPQKPFNIWEELLVFTDTHVYWWIETGFTSGPTVLPRDPESVVPEPSFLTDNE